MKGIKIELLGIATILLGIAVTTNNFFGYVLGFLGFGVAIAGCFLKDRLHKPFLSAMDHFPLHHH